MSRHGPRLSAILNEFRPPHARKLGALVAVAGEDRHGDVVFTVEKLHSLSSVVSENSQVVKRMEVKITTRAGQRAEHGLVVSASAQSRSGSLNASHLRRCPLVVLYMGHNLAQRRGYRIVEPFNARNTIKC